MQKWLPLNYSFVRIQNSLTKRRSGLQILFNFCPINEVSEAILNTIKAAIFA